MVSVRHIGPHDLWSTVGRIDQAQQHIAILGDLLSQVDLQHHMQHRMPDLRQPVVRGVTVRPMVGFVKQHQLCLLHHGVHVNALLVVNLRSDFEECLQLGNGSCLEVHKFLHAAIHTEFLGCVLGRHCVMSVDRLPQLRGLVDEVDRDLPRLLRLDPFVGQQQVSHGH